MYSTSSWAERVCPVSGPWIQLPSCWHLDILAPETPTPLLSHKHICFVISAGAGFGHTVHLTSLFYTFIPLLSYTCFTSSPLHPFLSPRFVPLLNIPQTLCNPKTPFAFIPCRMQHAVPGRNLLWSERALPAPHVDGSYTWAGAEALLQQPRNEPNQGKSLSWVPACPVPVSSSVSVDDGPGRSLGWVLFGFAHPPCSLWSLVCLHLSCPLTKDCFLGFFIVLVGSFCLFFILCLFFSSLFLCVGFLVLFWFLVFCFSLTLVTTS